MTRSAECNLDSTAASADRLTHAAWRLDTNTMAGILTATIATSGVVDTWEHLIRPVLGRSAPSGDPGWALVVERLLTCSISDAFTTARGLPAGAPVRVLLACADDEQHTLPVEALAAALIESGVGCRFLGARVPARALQDAITRCRPTVVGVWSQSHLTAHPAHLTSLLDAGGRTALIVALGPGWDHALIPAAISRPGGLGQTVALIRDTIVIRSAKPVASRSPS